MGSAAPGPDPQRIQWGTCTPGSRRQGFRRQVPTPGNPLKVTSLNSHIEGVETHWWESRTCPCLGYTGECPACLAGLATRWKGYFTATSPLSNQIMLCEITAYSVERLPVLIDRNYDLRGKKFTISRDGKYRNSPVIVTITGETPLPTRYPKPDVRDILMRMWLGGYRRARPDIKPYNEEDKAEGEL